mgnify:FL=1
MTRDFDELVKDFSGLVADYESHLRTQQAPLQPLSGFEQYLARKRRRRL